MFEHIDDEAMKISLAETVTHIVRPAESVTLSALTVTRMIDIPGEKKVFVNTREIGELLLWEGAGYDAIGQWTNLDVETRIIELISSNLG